MTARSTDEFMNIKEVADWFGVTENAVYGWRFRGYGPASFKLGRRVLFRRSVIEAWIAAQETNNPRHKGLTTEARSAGLAPDEPQTTPAEKERAGQ